MKRRELYLYFQALTSVNELKGVKFAYAVLKNKKKIEEEIKIFEEIIKPNPSFEEYEKKRISLCEVHSEKDSDGKPIINEDRYKLLDEKLFNKELDKLKIEYHSVIEERIKQINDYNSLLDGEIDVDFSKIDFLDVPTNISAKELESISFMVNID